MKQLARHASINTTVRHDRRPEQAKKMVAELNEEEKLNEAAELLNVPFSR